MQRLYAPLNVDLTSGEVADVFGNLDRLAALAAELADALVYRQARYRDYVHQVGDLLLAWVPRLQDPHLAYAANKCGAARGRGCAILLFLFCDFFDLISNG
jgi:hypothetical protein